MALHLLIGVCASVLLACGLLMMKSRAAHLPAARGRRFFTALAAWLGDPVWLAGLGLQSAGYALYVAALSGAPVSLLAVTMQGGIALFVLFAVLFLGERASGWEWIGLAGVLMAMLMLALSLGSHETPEVIDGRALAVISAGAIALSTAPITAGRLAASGVASAVASGVAFGLGSLYTKALTESFLAGTGQAILARLAANPYLYGAAAANLAGLILLQNAFHKVRGLIAMPLSSALSNVVPIIGGIAAFGERLPDRPAPAWLRLGAFALTIAAGALLAGTREAQPGGGARPPEPARRPSADLK